MASEQVCVVATCFNEAELISAFMERVRALPEMEHLLHRFVRCHGGDGVGQAQAHPRAQQQHTLM